MLTRKCKTTPTPCLECKNAQKYYINGLVKVREWKAQAATKYCLDRLRALIHNQHPAKNKWVESLALLHHLEIYTVKELKELEEELVAEGSSYAPVIKLMREEQEKKDKTE